MESNLIFFSVSDIASMLHVSRTGAYNIAKSEDFPAFRVGKRILVTKADFEEWVTNQRRKGCSINT